MSDAPLFQNADEQEQIYAPQQVPGNDQVVADEVGAAGPPASSDVGNTPAAVPLSTGGGAAAVPASDAFDPGMDREERDIARGDTGVVGRDPRDSAS